jgi:hypothetical protein
MAYGDIWRRMARTSLLLRIWGLGVRLLSGAPNFSYLDGRPEKHVQFVRRCPHREAYYGALGSRGRRPRNGAGATARRCSTRRFLICLHLDREIVPDGEIAIFDIRAVTTSGDLEGRGSTSRSTLTPHLPNAAHGYVTLSSRIRAQKPFLGFFKKAGPAGMHPHPSE